MNRITRTVAEAVHDRANGHCEACGSPLPSEGGVLHHRQSRRGGRHDVINLMEVHPKCHNMHTNSIHSRVARSIRLHHIVPMGEDPAETTPIVRLDLLAMIA